MGLSEYLTTRKQRRRLEEARFRDQRLSAKHTEHKWPLRSRALFVAPASLILWAGIILLGTLIF